MTGSALSAQSSGSTFEPGRVIGGRFEVQAIANSDGFGPLLLAMDRKTGRPVSLRVVAAKAVAAQLRAHAKAASDLTHPNLLPTFGLAQTEEGTSMVVQGPLLGRHLADYAQARRAGGKPVSLRGAYNVVAHVCNAITAIHTTGAHGAVRPSAVWIGDDGRVQLADLVIARAALAAGGSGGLSEDEAAFLAPEIKLGGAPQPASDLFGLGALLYVLLTGRNPNDVFVAPSEAHPEAHVRIDRELLRALSPDPAARHPSPEAFRTALLSAMGETEQESREDFGVDVEVEISLASIAPSRPARARASEGPAAVVLPAVPKAPRLPSIPGMPQAGARVSIEDDFRMSIVEDDAEAAAARERRSLGEVDLKDVLAKITEDDAPRWMLVKAGMDHGPFSGRQVVNMIVQGDALRDHELMNTDTGNRGKIGGFPEFHDFLAQYELRRGEQERAVALQKSETSEKHGAFFKVGIGIAAVAILGAAAGYYALTRSNAADDAQGSAEAGDLYKRGALEITGSAGILPMRRGGGGGRRTGAGGGGGGGAMSYEDAMMQAVDIGSAAGGGEQTLSAQTVAGVMNRQVNQIANACNADGKVTVDIAIASSGQVVGVSVNAASPGIQSCVADQVRRVRFPSFSAPRMGARYSF